MKKLTAKQTKFVQEFVKTNNATEAASRVYHVKNRNVANNIGAENLAKPSINQTISAEFKKEELDVAYVLKGLKEEADQIDDKNIRVKSLELIGKHLKMFTEVHENKDTTEKDVPLTGEERKKEIDQLLDRLNKLNTISTTNITNCNQ